MILIDKGFVASNFISLWHPLWNVDTILWLTANTDFVWQQTDKHAVTRNCHTGETRDLWFMFLFGFKLPPPMNILMTLSFPFRHVNAMTYVNPAASPVEWCFIEIHDFILTSHRHGFFNEWMMFHNQFTL